VCGISAVLLHPQDRAPSDWAAIRGAFTRNLLCNEERGREATGCAVVGNDGRVLLLKKPVNASRFAVTPEYHSLLDAIDSLTVLILGHTRLPTRGDPAFPSNNHPVEAGPVFGVHNGMVRNADDLFVRSGLPRGAEVDSEIIFRLLATVVPASSGAEYLSSVRPLICQLEGEFTFLACDRRRPDQLLVLKHENPLSACFREDWRALFFSSQYLFLRKSFGEHIHAESLPDDRLLLFEAGRIPAAGLRPAACLDLFEGTAGHGG